MSTMTSIQKQIGRFYRLFTYRIGTNADPDLIELEDGKVKINGAIEGIYPIGAFYVQYPNASSNTAGTAFPSAYSPATLFGGTWALQYGTEGIVFQTEGYDGAGRTNGLMEDQMQQITGKIRFNAASAGTVGALSIASNTLTGNAVQTTTAGAGEMVFNSANSSGARTGTKTSHRNRLMRVYKRTA